MKKLISLSLVATLLASCSTAPTAPIQSSSGFARDDLRAFRDYITADEPLHYPVQAEMPIAYVMLDNNDKGRNRKICRAFEGLGLEADVGGFGTETGVPTYWLLTSDEVPATKDLDDRCDFLIANFDYARATQIANAAKVPKLSSAYVLAWDKSTPFYVDIDDGDINRALNWWFEIAAANPDKPGIAMQDWLGKTCGKGFMASYEELSAKLEQSQLGQTVGVPASAGSVALDAIPGTRLGIEVADGFCKLIFPVVEDFI